jgi:uncharacterized protein (DUF952 family)
LITHITEQDLWHKAKETGTYVHKSLESDGFIHCSNLDQVIKVANYLFKGQENLLLLYIDEKKVNSKIVYEDLYNAGEKYPHIYGPLNIDAVVEVHDFIPKEDGTFQLPEK